MSLKARIEAVIYAAEEPVTLAQLAALFGAEALEQKQAREEALAAEAAALAEADARQAEEVVAVPAPGHQAESKDEPAEPEPPAAQASAADSGPEETAPKEASEDAETPNSEPEPESQPEPEPDPELSPEAEAQAVEAEEKRLARQRERDIRDEIRATLDELIADYESNTRGMEIREIAGGYRVGTKPEYHDAVRAFVKGLKPPIKLSLQALETLAVVAYKQPITAPEISEIRGVDSSGVLGSLISRKLINTAGRKQVIGRPILYKTTKEFLLRFGLKDLGELPSMEEFEKMAGELNDNDEEPAQNENLPFNGEDNGPDTGADTNQDTGETAVEEAESGTVPIIMAPAITAEELAYRAEHGAPPASIPSVIQITVESESEILEDLPGVEIDAGALKTAPDDKSEAPESAVSEPEVEEPSEK